MLLLTTSLYESISLIFLVQSVNLLFSVFCLIYEEIHFVIIIAIYQYRFTIIPICLFPVRFPLKCYQPCNMKAICEINN